MKSPYILAALLAVGLAGCKTEVSTTPTSSAPASTTKIEVKPAEAPTPPPASSTTSTTVTTAPGSSTTTTTPSGTGRLSGSTTESSSTTTSCSRTSPARAPNRG